MRFTTLSTLINAFIISSVALLSWIQVTNAQVTGNSPDTDLVFIITNPVAGQVYYTGDDQPISWEWGTYENPVVTGTVYLKNDFLQYSRNYGNVDLSSEVYDISYPEPAPNFFFGNSYYIEMTSPYGNTRTGNFTIIYRK